MTPHPRFTPISRFSGRHPVRPVAARPVAARSFRLPLPFRQLLRGGLTLPGKGLLVSAVLGLLVMLLILFGVPRLLDGTRQGQAVANQIAQATGQRVVIEGKVEVSLWPRAHIGINRFKLVSPDGQTTLLSAPRLDLNVTLASLLGGQYAVNEITLQQPELNVQAAATPWGWLPDAARLQALPVRRLSVNDGRLQLNRNGQSETISAISGEVILPDQSTLLRTRLAGQWRGAPAQLMIDVAAPLGSDPSLASMSLQIGAAEASFSLSGLVDFSRPGHPLQGQLELSAGQGAALWALAASLGWVSAPPADAALHQPLALSAIVNGNSAGYNLEGIKLALGDWKVEGLARFVTGADGGLSVALQTDAIDLARWPTLLDWGRRGTLALPPAWLGAFDLKVAGVGLGSAQAEAVRLKGEIRDGILTFGEVSARLPGDTRVSLNGQMTTRAGQAAAFDGHVSLESLQLRTLLQSWGVALPAALDPAALQQIRLASDVRGNWGSWGLSGLDLQLDGVHLTGQVSPPGSDGLFAANLAIEQLDLARYTSSDALPAWLWQLPPTNLTLRLSRVTAGDRSAENVSLRARLAGRLLSIQSLDAADFGGNKIRLSGSVSADANRDADLTLRLIAPDFPALVRSFPPAAQLVPAILSGWMGANTDLSVRWLKSAGELQQLSSATFADGRFDVVVSRRPGALPVWKARVQHRETAVWLRLLAPGLLSRPDAILGLTDFYAEGQQLEAGRWQLRALQGQLGGLSLRDGTLVLTPPAATLEPWQIEGQVEIGQGSFDLWAQTLAPGAVLPRLSGVLSVQAERLLWRGDALDGVSAELRFGPNGQIALPKASGRWHEGTFSLSGQGQFAPVPGFKGTLDLRETSLAWQGGSRFGLDGMLDAAVRLEAQGADAQSLWRSLKGDGEFSIDSGTLQGLDFAGLTRVLRDRKSRSEVDAQLARGGESPLSTFGGDFVIEEGILRAPQLRLRLPAASADVSADLNLVAARLDANARISLRDAPQVAPFTVRLSGALDNLLASFETGTLLAAPAPAGDAAPPVQPAGDNPAQDPPADAVSHQEDDPVAVRLPEIPTPPSAEEPVAQPLADVLEPAPAPAPSSRRASSRRAASQSSRPAAPPPEVPAAADDLPPPPSIQELLQAMPALQGTVGQAMALPPADAAAVPAVGGVPQISFTPAPAAPPVAPSAARPAGGVAPEFAGQAPRGTSDSAPVVSTGATPQVDVVSTDDNGPPAASPDELIGTVPQDPAVTP